MGCPLEMPIRPQNVTMVRLHCTYQVLATICLLLFTLSGKTQEYSYPNNSDFETWTSVGANYKLNKKWKLALQEQFRLNEYSSVMDRLITQVESELRPLKAIRLGLAARHFVIRDNGRSDAEYEHHFRAHFDFSWKFDFWNIYVTNRFRHQWRNEIGKSRLEGDYSAQDIRHKISVAYKNRKCRFQPKIATEYFFHFQIGEFNGYSRSRYTIGTDYRLTSGHKISIYYLREKENRIWNPAITHIIQAKYRYYISKKKKKEKEEKQVNSS